MSQPPVPPSKTSKNSKTKKTKDDPKAIRINKARENYKELKHSLKAIYKALFPEATIEELKIYGSALNNPNSIHASVDYFEKVVIGSKVNSNFKLATRIEKLKNKLNIV